jgi:hypothetical protein
MDPNRWDAFTDAELTFISEAIEISDWEGGYGRSGLLDLWESALDAMEARPTIDTDALEIAVDRAAIARHRHSQPAAQKP